MGDGSSAIGNSGGSEVAPGGGLGGTTDSWGIWAENEAVAKIGEGGDIGVVGGDGGVGKYGLTLGS